MARYDGGLGGKMLLKTGIKQALLKTHAIYLQLRHPVPPPLELPLLIISQRIPEDALHPSSPCVQALITSVFYRDQTAGADEHECLNVQCLMVSLRRRNCAYHW